MSGIFEDCRPLRGLVAFSNSFSWGLRPRHYAGVRFADCCTIGSRGKRGAVARFAGCAPRFVIRILGLTPQALRWRPLRGLLHLYERVQVGCRPLRGARRIFLIRILGLTPQALRWRPLRELLERARA